MIVIVVDDSDIGNDVTITMMMTVTMTVVN